MSYTFAAFTESIHTTQSRSWATFPRATHHGLSDAQCQVTVRGVLLQGRLIRADGTSCLLDAHQRVTQQRLAGPGAIRLLSGKSG